MAIENVVKYMWIHWSKLRDRSNIAIVVKLLTRSIYRLESLSFFSSFFFVKTIRALSIIYKAFIQLG